MCVCVGGGGVDMLLGRVNSLNRRISVGGRYTVGR